jgi:hypothetical protein
MVEHPKMSCKVQAKLDWHDTGEAGKWTREQEALKLSTRLYQQAGEDYEKYPATVFTTKLRVPGSGNTLQLRYQGQPGKPFKWLGCDTTFLANTEK